MGEIDVDNDASHSPAVAATPTMIYLAYINNDGNQRIYTVEY